MPIELTKKIEDSSMTDESVKSLASTSAVLAVMASVTPNINELLETNMLKVSEGFTKIAEAGRNLQQKLESIEDAENIKGDVDVINSQVMEVIMGMQFQDRLSQNLVILKDISEEIKNSVAETLQNLPKEVDKDLLRNLLALIKLGEIRSVFIDHLVENGYISGPDELDYNIVDDSSGGNDDIELF